MILFIILYLAMIFISVFPAIYLLIVVNDFKTTKYYDISKFAPKYYNGAIVVGSFDVFFVGLALLSGSFILKKDLFSSGALLTFNLLLSIIILYYVVEVKGHFDISNSGINLQYAVSIIKIVLTGLSFLFTLYKASSKGLNNYLKEISPNVKITAL